MKVLAQVPGRKVLAQEARQESPGPGARQESPGPGSQAGKAWPRKPGRKGRPYEGGPHQNWTVELEGPAELDSRTGLRKEGPERGFPRNGRLLGRGKQVMAFQDRRWPWWPLLIVGGPWYWWLSEEKVISTVPLERIGLWHYIYDEMSWRGQQIRQVTETLDEMGLRGQQMCSLLQNDMHSDCQISRMSCIRQIVGRHLWEDLLRVREWVSIGFAENWVIELYGILLIQSSVGSNLWLCSVFQNSIICSKWCQGSPAGWLP